MPFTLQNNENALNAANLLKVVKEFGCPVWAYDAQVIEQRIAQLRQFDMIRFAQKASSNIHILRLMREQGVKVDSVSLGEIERALIAGFKPGYQPGSTAKLCLPPTCWTSRRWSA